MANSHSAQFDITNYLSRTDANLSAGFVGKSTGGHTGDFTIQCWFKPTTLTGSQTLVSKDDGGAQRSFLIQLSGDQLLASYDGGNAYVFTSNATFVAGTYSHIAVIATPSTTSFTILQDGVVLSLSGVTGASTSVPLTNAPLVIGSRGGVDRFYDGLIDDVRIDNVALSVATIQADYLNQITPYASTQANYKFDDDAGNADLLSDATANNNDVTNTNSVISSTDIPSGGGGGNVAKIGGIDRSTINKIGGVSSFDKLGGVNV